MKEIPIATIDQLSELYDVLLFDAYGVLVNSHGALPGAIPLIQQLNRKKKPYFIVTNDASKLPDTSAKRFKSYGLTIGSDKIISSGSLLPSYFERHSLKGSDCAVLGPEDSERYVEQAGGNIVSPSEHFDALVIADERGFPFLKTVDQVLTSLCRSIARGYRVHLILPNPDLIYPKPGDGLGFTAGSIAAMFERVLARRYPRRADLRFVHLGKPEPALFEAAWILSGTRNMVMIGDQLETDIKGAQAFGIDSVWLQSGVSPQMAETASPDMWPTYRLNSLLDASTAAGLIISS